MADYATALALTLKHEGGFFHNQQTGEIVNLGITIKTYRGLVDQSATEETIRNLTHDQAAAFYKRYYWDPIHGDQIGDQMLANKIFDIAVNMGYVMAVRLLQEACNSLGHSVTVDGHFGTITLAAVNLSDPVLLLGEFRKLAAHHYAAIAGANPTLAGNLTGWLERLKSA